MRLSGDIQPRNVGVSDQVSVSTIGVVTIKCRIVQGTIMCRLRQFMVPRYTEGFRGGKRSGGSCEIRTHGGRETSPVFKTGAFNRSAKLPYYLHTTCTRFHADACRVAAHRNLRGYRSEA